MNSSFDHLSSYREVVSVKKESSNARKSEGSQDRGLCVEYDLLFQFHRLQVCFSRSFVTLREVCFCVS
uniref:Uncharacterized protein n=1 Tax=Helianthus annuus TaxID=4232 RepID=A0A251UTD8_HELAN